MIFLSFSLNLSRILPIVNNRKSMWWDVTRTSNSFCFLISSRLLLLLAAVCVCKRVYSCTILTVVSVDLFNLGFCIEGEWIGCLVAFMVFCLFLSRSTPKIHYAYNEWEREMMTTDQDDEIINRVIKINGTHKSQTKITNKVAFFCCLQNTHCSSEYGWPCFVRFIKLAMYTWIDRTIWARRKDVYVDWLILPFHTIYFCSASLFFSFPFSVHMQDFVCEIEEKQSNCAPKYQPQRKLQATRTTINGSN